MTTKRTKKQTEEVIHYLHEFAEYKAAPSWTKKRPFDKRPSVPEYYFREGMRVALEILVDDSYVHAVRALDALDDEQREAIRMMVEDA